MRAIQRLRQAGPALVGLLLAAAMPTAWAGASVAGDDHPRAAAREGRITHDKLSPELWPRDSTAVTADREPGPAEAEGVEVVVHGDVADASLVERIRRHAERLGHLSERHRQISLRVANRQALLAIADLDGVRRIERQWAPERFAGSVTSRAVRALAVEHGDRARTPLRSGDGQKLGILSDSFACTEQLLDDPDCNIDRRDSPNPVQLRGLSNQASDDLPKTIEIFADDVAGTDEGAATAELAYDIAPNSEFVFHTGFLSQGDFADGFERLCRSESAGGAGATAVVDDVLWPTEPMYQPGIIAQQATACVDAGVPVFSAVGNLGGNAFRQDYSDIDPANDGDFGDDFHDWGGDRAAVPVELNAGESFRVVLQWNQPWSTLAPDDSDRGPGIDLDLYIADDSEPDADDLVGACSGTLGRSVCQSIRDQVDDDGTPDADPYEILEFTAPRDDTFYLVVDHVDGSKDAIPQADGVPLEFRLVFLGLEDGRLDGEEVMPGPDRAATVYGHAAAAGVIAVGAVPWWTTLAFDPTRDDSPTDDIDVQPFSSRGGVRTQMFDAEGRFIGLERPQSPQFVAVDGTNNTFFGGDVPTNQDGEPDEFPNFSGTSAAAPNAAAVGMLLQEFAPDLSPGALERLLVKSATEVGGERGETAIRGAGLVDAQAAADAFPVAFAGRKRAVAPGETVTLDGSGSAARSGVAIETFQWSQTAGPEGELENGDSAQATARVPNNAETALTFQLTITDGDGGRDQHTVTLQPAAVLSPDSGEDDEGDGSSCFIATAAYGSPQAAEIDHLRALRDRVLARTLSGQLFVDLYYRWSPPVAVAIGERPRMRAAVRWGLRPLIAAVARPAEAALLFATISLLLGGLAARRPRSPQ